MWSISIKPMEGKPVTFSQKKLTLGTQGKRLEAFFLMVINDVEASLHQINCFCEDIAYHLMNRQPVC